MTNQTMTAREAAQALKQREQDLAEAKAALDDYERNVGQHALDVGVDEATAEMLKRQIAVKAAETAIAAARVEVEECNRQDAAARVVHLRAEADKLDKEAAERMAIVNEWGPKVQQAREEANHLSLQAQRMIDQAADIERRLQRQAQQKQQAVTA